MEKEKDKTFFGMKIDNHVSIGHIFTTLAIIVAFITWSVNTDNRLAQLEKADAQFRQEFSEYKNDYKADLREIRQLFQQISDKLDKKADR